MTHIHRSVVAFACAVLGSAVPGFAISSFNATADATLRFVGPSTQLFTFRDPVPSVIIDNTSDEFADFVINSHGGAWDADNLTLTVNAATNGAANFTGAEDPAYVSGATRAGFTIGVVNPTELGLFLDVEIDGLFTYQGDATNHGLEGAETFVAMSFLADELSGIPDDNLLLVRQNTWDQSPRGDFDQVTAPFLLGVDTRYSIFVPPSDTMISPGVIERRVWSIGLFVQAGGAAISEDSGSLIVSEIPPSPIVIDPPVIPEPSSSLLLLVGAGALVLRRRRLR